jgi:hypothetical protein
VGASVWCVLTDCGCLHAIAITKDLEPGFGAVLAVGVAEFGFEDASFVSSAPDLHDDYQQQYKKRPPGHEQIERDSREEDQTEKINWIADFGVDAGGDESARFGTRGEKFPELQAGGEPAGISERD